MEKKPSAGTHLAILAIDCGRKTLGIHRGPTPHTLPEQSKGWDPQAASCRRGQREDGTAEIPNEARGNCHVKAKLQAAVWLQTKEELASSGPPHPSCLQNTSVGPTHARMRTHTHQEVNRASEKKS